MAIIRVDPDILKSQSTVLSTISGEVSISGKLAQGAAASAPSYDGQFGPKVQAIGAEAITRANGLSFRLGDHSGSLFNRASAFEIADSSISASLLSNPHQPGNILIGMGLIGMLRQWLINLVNLRSLPGLSGLIGSGGDVLSEGVSTTTITERQFNENFFKTVISDGPNNGYKRHGFDGVTDSDCTWYAAEAVTKASEGKVDFSTTHWGNAYDWAKNAKKDIPNKVKGVDQIPQSGDIIVIDGINEKGERIGHVAFVENVVVNSDGTYTLTISEESADASTTNKVPPAWGLEKNQRDFGNDDRNLRWRKTFDLDMTKTGKSKVSFIHPNY